MKLGCIADDFTGATDLALMLKQSGFRVIQSIGIPDGDDLENVDAWVIALKTRSCDPRKAIGLSIAAAEWLDAAGAQQIYFKYCSTFDSTNKGNIGPVADALMSHFDCPVCVACPSFPGNGRTVYQGHLFVFEKLLSESGMRNHPLNPMTNSNLVEVLQEQSSQSVGLISAVEVDKGIASLKALMNWCADNEPGLKVIDAVHDEQLDTIAHSVIEHKVVSGGSALAGALARVHVQSDKRRTKIADSKFEYPPGRSVILAGSCSTTTLSQIQFCENKIPIFKINPTAISEGAPIQEPVLNWIDRQPKDKPVLVYASEQVSDVNAIDDRSDVMTLGKQIESAMGGIAKSLLSIGFRRFVVAGGETSGAVVRGLGIQQLRVADEIDPGVPWVVSNSSPPVALALKSGNFGEENFFLKALDTVDQ